MKKLLGFILAMIMTLAIFPSAYAADNMYTIDDVYFSNLSGTILENPSRTCLVNIELTKTAERVGEDTVVIASYSTDGKMIGFTTVGGTVERGNKAKFATLVIVPEDKEIGIVKTYVWNNVSEMMPLSEVYTEIVNELDEGVELPSVDQPAVEELYIPETVTVIGIITDVPKSQSGAVENDEYRIEITSAPIECNSATTEEEYNYLKNRYEAMYNIFFGMTISEINESPVTRIMKSTLDLNGYLFYEGRITVNKNYEILNFEPTGSTKAEELNAADYVKSAELAAENQYESNGKVRFGSTYYKLANEVEIYVNGVNVAEVDKTAGDNTTLDTYLGGAQGTVKLVKLADDTNYSKIFVDYYIIGEVTSVTYKSNTTTVNFAGNRGVRKIVIDDDNLESGDTIVTAKKGDAEIELKDIAKDDIIAVAYNPEEVASNTLTNPSFLTVLATDKTITDMVADKSSEDETVTVGENIYSLVDWDALSADIMIRTTYIFTLDPFGRIYSCEAMVTADDVAILEKWNFTEEEVTLVLPDGSTAKYPISCSPSDITSILYSEGTTKARVQDRVVEYTVKTSTGAISRITKLEGVEDKAAEYKDRSGKLGSFSLSDATQILNAEKYVKEVEELEDDEVTVVANGSTSDYAGWTTDSLQDGSKYKAYAYKKGSSYYSFILITKGGAVLNADSSFAVVKGKVKNDYTEDSYGCASVMVLQGGEEVKLYIDAYAEDVELDYGDIFFYEMDKYGMVEAIYKIYDHAEKAFYGMDALEGLYNEEDWFVPYDDETCFTKNAFDNQLVYGILTDVNSEYVEFGVVNENVIDRNIYNTATGDNGLFDFSISTECVAYEYDMASDVVKESEKINAISASKIKASDFSAFEDEDDSNIINYTEKDGKNPEDYTNYAVAMVVDGEIVDIVSYRYKDAEIITADTDKDVTMYNGYKTCSDLSEEGQDFDSTGYIRYRNIIYKLSENVELYVNDSKYDGTVNNESLDTNLKNADYVILKADSTNKCFDKVMVYKRDKNIAILEKWNSTEEEATLVLPNGSTAKYPIVCSPSDITSILYSEGTTKARVQDRVVEYAVRTSTGEISRITKLEGTEDTAAEYKARTSKLGSFAITDDTKLLNAEEYIKEVEEISDDVVTVVANGSVLDYEGWTKASLIDGSDYKVFAYDKIGSYWSFVLITKTRTVLTDQSRFAVVKNAVKEGVTADGYVCASVDVLYGNEVVKLYIDADYRDVDLDYGDAFYFELDSDGLVPVANIYKIYDHSSTTFAGVDALAGLYDEEDWFVPGEGETCFTKNAFDVQLVYGIVTDVKSSAIEFGVVKDNKIDGNKYNLAAGDEGIFDFDIDSDCVAYEYDTTSSEVKEWNKFSITSTSSILASNFSIFENEDDDLIIDYVETDGEDPADYANYAVAMVVDGSIVAIYSIVNN